jgi:hypothetical protein
MNAEPNVLLIQFVPMLLIQVVFCFPNYFLAKRMRKSAGLYAILTLIPFFGLFFSPYVVYRSIFTLYDRLSRAEAPTGPATA